MPKALSKSRYTKGLQCPKLLWWAVHEPDSVELILDEAVAVRMKNGRRVGELAREYVPGGTLIDLNLADLDQAVSSTQEALDQGVPVIYEACFRAEGLFVAVDILEKREDGWVVVEVKSSQKVKPHHLPDLAVQVHVVRASGLPVVGAEIMHLSKKARFPDLDKLFVRSDQTEAVGEQTMDIAQETTNLRGVLEGACPDVSVGDHCRQPYACPFWRRCWPPSVPHQVTELYRLHKTHRAALAQLGVSTIAEVPADFPLNAIASRQRQAVLENRRIVEPSLKEALAPLEGKRLAFLDFESIGPAIPTWSACQPHQPVPVQMSCHAEDELGVLHHLEWLAQGSPDPRPALAQAVVQAAHGADQVLAYFAPFERKMLLHLARVVPRYATELKQIAERLFDLLPVVRNHVYDPEFNGSFSLKKVYPALVGGPGYTALAVQDGGAAAHLLEDYLLRGGVPSGAGEESFRTNLLAYCKQDTQALVELLSVLRGLTHGFANQEI
jgi:predicted RecB family nuclease